MGVYIAWPGETAHQAAFSVNADESDANILKKRVF